MTKKLLGIAVIAIILSGVFYLAGCAEKKVHDIPDGDYCGQVHVENIGTTFTLRQSGNPDDYFWRIKGNKATWYASNQKSRECNIIKEENDIYFVGDGNENTETFKQRVEYDGTSKKITVFSS